MSAKPRPVYLALPNIRLPIPGLVSMLHRISGVSGCLLCCLSCCISCPVALSQESAFETYRAIVSHALVKLVYNRCIVGLSAPFSRIYPLFILDAHKGLGLNTARNTAKAVFASALVLTVVLRALLW